MDRPSSAGSSVGGGWIVLGGGSATAAAAAAISDSLSSGGGAEAQYAALTEGVLVKYNPFSIVHRRSIVMHDSLAFLKSCESMAFLIRDVAHITPHNFSYCVQALRTFVEASYVCRSDGDTRHPAGLFRTNSILFCLLFQSCMILAKLSIFTYKQTIKICIGCVFQASHCTSSGSNLRTTR